jgi:serine/threonine protein kinase/Tol biopolymer transport system component
MSEINSERDDTPLVSVSRYAAAQTDFADHIGERVGAYRIIGEVGRGGMGAVYLAERDDSEFRRRVAIKVVKRGMDTDSILRRFRNERQILASLDHPNIARLLDGGTTADGRPYFVMEYINGAPLTQYCDARRLGIPERLRLFQQVCAALSYAHQNLVIHRDVKPSNILVTEDGTPKLLDFGIAKLLNPELAHDTLAPTTLSVRPMTPEYASPEQVRGDTVTPASDQYSLGVLLYELLTGHRPYNTRNGAFLEVARRICEETPERPSKLVTLRRDAATANDEEAKTSITLQAICESRGVTAEALRRELENGLDSIILLALRKEPAERYASVAELSADITRFLNGQPVAAPPPVATRPATQRNEYGWRPSRVALLLLAALMVCAVAGFAAYRFLKGRPRADASAARVSIPSPEMSLKRLTTSGKERLPVISPDGRFIAHVSFEGGGQSLWLLQAKGGVSTQLVARAERLYLGLAFSPDSNYLYYTLTDRSSIEGKLYRVSVNGGEPEKVLEPVSSPLGFAPDGQRFAYAVATETTSESRLLVANVDGSGTPRLLATHTLFNFFYSNPAWSPDGRMIACAMGDFSETGFSFKLAAFDANTGAESMMMPRGFADLTQVAWLNDGGGLVITARDTLSSPMQLWHVAYPSGELRRITNDLNNYDGISLTADNSMLVTSKRDDQANLFTVELSQTAGDKAQATELSLRQITTGVERQDGINGLRWTADGRVLYVASASDGTDICLIDADGANRRRLTRDVGQPESPSMTPDGRYVVFGAYRDDQFSVWRLDTTTGAITQLTTNLAFYPTLTPDGRSVIHTQVLPSGKSSLHRTPIEGGAAQMLASFNARRPVVSPDGRWIACNFNNEQQGGEWQIAVVRIEGGEPTHVLQLPGFPDSQAPPERPLAWTPDNCALLYINDKDKASNIWRVTLDTGVHQQLTHFNEGRIFNFALSPDGRRLVLARGSTATDIVLFRNFR